LKRIRGQQWAQTTYCPGQTDASGCLMKCDLVLWSWAYPLCHFCILNAGYDHVLLAFSELLWNSSAFPWPTKITELCLMGQNSISTPESISFPTSLKILKDTKIRVGDVLVSHKQGYHHVVISIRENLADILWLERVEGEPTRFYHYVRQIKIDNALSYYGHIPADKLDRSMYRKPNEGWSKE
jgi:hypothetical protein